MADVSLDKIKNLVSLHKQAYTPLKEQERLRKEKEKEKELTELSEFKR